MSFNLAVILGESARCAPDRPVAVFDGGQLSYGELDQASDRIAANLAVLPLFHVFGLSSIMDVCVRFGCTMSLIPRFTPRRC